MGRIRDGRDAGGIAGRRPEQRGPADVDHLDRLVEADELDADGGRERLDVDDDQVDQADALGSPAPSSWAGTSRRARIPA